MKISILITFLFIFVPGIQAKLDEVSKHPIGIVTQVQGSASILNKLRPLLAKKDTIIYNDSSIYCPENCHLTIKLNNKLSFIKIGQKTNIHLLEKDDNYSIKLHIGFIQTLFKSSEKFKMMKITTKNAQIISKNSKTLSIFNPYFVKTSLINFKGKVSFQKLSGESLTLSKLEYSNLLKDNEITPAEFLPPKRLDSLLNAFEIKKQQIQ